LDCTDKDQIARYQNFVSRLRAENTSAELNLGSSGMNAQLKYADKRGSLCAVIQGSNERDHEDGLQGTIRDLVLGTEFCGFNKRPRGLFGTSRQSPDHRPGRSACRVGSQGSCTGLPGVSS
jgi:hypothetical protein